MLAQWQQWKTAFPTQIVDMGDGLMPTGRTIKGQIVTDGPTIESKELVSGYSIVEGSKQRSPPSTPSHLRSPRRVGRSSRSTTSNSHR
ncbi:MAG: hypothetical protein Q8N23_16830 [Archangium sp.]|nr:hypothetical protein [Archangium sp.]